MQINAINSRASVNKNFKATPVNEAAKLLKNDYIRICDSKDVQKINEVKSLLRKLSHLWPDYYGKGNPMRFDASINSGQISFHTLEPDKKYITFFICKEDSTKPFGYLKGLINAFYQTQDKFRLCNYEKSAESFFNKTFK